MCDPLTLTGLALTAGSMVVNNIAQGKVDDARNEVLRAETRRQQDFNREVEQVNDETRDLYVGFDEQQAQRADTLADMFGSSVGDPNATTAGIIPRSSSDIVNVETDKRMADAQDYVDQQSGALATMRSFGDLLGTNSMLQARGAGKVAQLGGFKQGSQAIMPYELDHANKAGDGMKLFGDVLRMAGTTATGAGINGGSANIANMFGGKSGGFFPGLNGPSLGGAPSAWGL